MIRTVPGAACCRLERVVRSSLNGRINPVTQRRHGSTSQQNNASPMYELRTYDVKPKYLADFMKLTSENIHLRLAHSRLCGYWMSELGALHQAVQVCEYENFAHRSAVRKALSEDEAWINNYISHFMKMLIKQDNVVLRSVPWCPVKPATPVHDIGGVYELCIDTLIPGKLEQWAHRLLMQGLETREKFSEPVGIWTTEVGVLNKVYHLWRYKSMDDRTEVQRASLNDEEWQEAVRDCASFTLKSENKILVPTAWSEWK